MRYARLRMDNFRLRTGCDDQGYRVPLEVVVDLDDGWMHTHV